MAAQAKPKGERVKCSATALLIAGSIAAIGAPVASAHTLHPHQHFITTPNGETHEVGPSCSNPNAARGFHQYHHNVHTGQPQEAFAENPITYFITRGCP